MLFYQECLGGELYLQTVGESPMAERLPKQMKDFILHASLQQDNKALMGTDMVGEEGLVRGNSVSILIECTTEHEIREYYKKLSAGGKSVHPIEKTFWGALFGGLIDKFGNHWLLHFDAGF